LGRSAFQTESGPSSISQIKRRGGGGELNEIELSASGLQGTNFPRGVAERGKFIAEGDIVPQVWQKIELFEGNEDREGGALGS